MDVFFEQIIRKKPNTVQLVMKILFILAAIVLIFSLVLFAVINLGYNSFLAPLSILAAFGVGFGAYWYIKRMYVEYEYSITNGDFDIDRILGKSKRSRIISTNCADFEEFGIYDAAKKEQLSHREFDSKVLAANLKEEGLYYAVVNHKTAGRVLIVIQPNERIVSALKKFIPRTVQNDVFGH
ncbi:MAG: hypothetical protein ACI39F_02385 [Acutalibacteraceae bacterium]